MTPKPQPLCGACGAVAPLPFRIPAPELSPDLDMRPGEPARSTLLHWVQVCGQCGAAAPDLSALPASAREIVEGDEYRDMHVEPPDAIRFLRWAMLAPPADRAEAMLHAAWMADDAGMNATVLRRQAASAWPDEADSASDLRRIDVLRRAGAFEEARARLDVLEAQRLDEDASRVAAFQRARVLARDRGRHLLGSALRPPATMPHVAHGRARPSDTGRIDARRGFWARLTGR